LRTLVLGRRDVSRSEKDKFLKAWRAAETATEDRKGKLAEAAALIERDFEIVGATAIEDRLQDGVPETIHELAKAEIKLWVLTGDKVETAINIAKSAKLLTDDMFLVKLPVRAPRLCSCLRCRGHHHAIDAPHHVERERVTSRLRAGRGRGEGPRGRLGLGGAADRARSCGAKSSDAGPGGRFCEVVAAGVDTQRTFR